MAKANATKEKKVSSNKVTNNKKNKNTKKVTKKSNKKIQPKKNVKEIKRKKSFSIGLLDLFILLVITAIVSCVGTGLILNYQYNKKGIFYNAAFKSDDNINEFINVYSDVIDNYYEKVDGSKLIDAAIDGMLGYLEDEYSIYLGTDGTDELSNNLNGSYSGIGIGVVGCEIITVYKDSPAMKAGLQKGDIIKQVDDLKITDDNYDKIAEIISEKKGKSVAIVVLREEKELSFNVEVSEVKVPVVASDYFKFDNKSIGYLSIATFSSTAYEQFQEELVSLEDKKIDSLIIDLRNNGGGYLNAATDISSIFLEKGKVIYSLERKNKKEKKLDKTKEKKDYKLVVLINESTASSAEVLTAALKDSYGAIVVGKKSYGKGTVQNTHTLKDGTMLKYTFAKWLRPNGECIDGKGIVPDYEVELKDNKDTQLEKAFELLK